MSSQHKLHTRALLALDGHTLGRELLATVFRRCVHLCPRLDILLINPPREPTTLLAVLLLRLEHSGVDYRLSSAHGDMGEEILRYLGRYRGIASVALTDPAQLSVETRRLIELKGHQLILLSEA
ncbi:MAG: hypothetical protein COW48_02425 [Hydrogenophilales bacterium CG17_big_fil_post_rev_8_21_14_2_50_63_12]|nr:MAG: hypothetical protein COW48_02425 [Hydrogenophilales bacterium CG17_big_fil_post_rev_8_21_14_2_50_63_12]PIX97715.1 MAG: hypothetical protein COZ24_03950 [Hydrogenophilales bacterium CG_4_10_14_3_um_filter_63_21]PJB02996.1 MAG: hypothetical protein CO126_09165 [Hydrogenophilales bacterium CG_4_9_14_3_um_filter_63_34]